jgi:uncharacterized protein (TIGR01777 family)
MRVVIAGGSGFLGSALTQRLRAENHDVAVLTRRPGRPGDLAWDPAAPGGEWRRAIDGSDAVINLAGESIDGGRWTRARKSAIFDSRITATEAIVGAIAGAGRPPAVLLNGSAIGIYGAHRDEVVTETSGPADDFLARVCVAWESAAAAAATTTRVVLLRTGLALDRTAGALPRLALPFHLMVGGPVSSGRQWWSWIHVDDWVAMARWAIEREELSGPINLTAPAPVTNREFATTLGRVLRRPAGLPAPAFALRLALGEMADALILTGQRVLPARASEGGFTFRYATLEAALRAIYS